MLFAMTGTEVALIITAIGGVIIGIISAVLSGLAAVYASAAKSKAESVDSKVIAVAVKQEKQHEEINGKLAEKDRLTIAAKIAEGIIIGRKELQAEMDAKAVAANEGARAALAAIPAAPISPAPVPAIQPANVPKAIEGFADAVVDKLGEKSAKNKEDPKKSQVPVTLPPGPPEPH